MSAKLRGQEVTVRIAVNGRTLKGSFFKVTEFEITPRQEIVEDDYLGEDTSDLDFQHHGYDFRFTVHQIGPETLDLLTDLEDSAANHERPPQVTVTALYAYREPGVGARAVVLHDALIIQKPEGFKGRKERVTVEYEGKAKKREVIAA